jgi:hypothetical protein
MLPSTLPAHRQPPVSNRAQALRPASSPPPRRQPVSSRVVIAQQANPNPVGLARTVSQRAQSMRSARAQGIGAVGVLGMVVGAATVARAQRTGTISAGNQTSPWQVGIEWATGAGPRHRNFGNEDAFTEMLKKHERIEHTRNIIKNNIKNHGPWAGTNPYRLGVPLYIRDYSTLLTGGKTGNLAVTYLGSYNLTYQVLSVNKGSAIVKFRVENSSTIASATHPPVIGYTDW